MPNNDYTVCIKWETQTSLFCISSFRCFFNIYPPVFTPYGGGLAQSLLLNDSKDLENVPDTFNLPAPTVQEK